MRRILLLLSFIFSFCGFAQQYPATKKIQSTVTRQNISYEDNYRWLENMTSPEVDHWVNAQNEITYQHLDEAKKPFNAAFKIKDYDFLSSNSLPYKNGKYFYAQYRVDKLLPATLFYRKTLNDAPKVALNPYDIYKDKNVMLSNYYPSKNSIYIAGKFSLNGGDRHEIRFSEINTLKTSDDVLTDVKFSTVAWNKDLGVFYKKNSNRNTFARDSTYQLFYHRLGTSQNDDVLVLDVTKKESTISFYTTKTTLVVIESSKDESNTIYYECKLEDETFSLEPILEFKNNEFEVLKYKDGRIYFSSTKFDWGEIRSFDVKNRQDEKVVVPQIYMKLLESSYFYDDYIVCKYKTLGKYLLMVYDTNGKFIRKFDAPEGTDFNIHFYDSTTKDLFVSFSSYTISSQNFKLNIETGEVKTYFNDYIKPKVTLFPLDYFTTKTITYKSRDDKDVPITIIHKKNMVLDGNNPTLLEAYGGFGLVSGPHYDTGLLYFLEKGGVYAYAEIRGGGEKGIKWHTDAIGLKKKNSFNDFIDAAEFLIAEKYTSPQKLAISGGSYGGLVVGVAMTQRPELFKVVIPNVGVFDMARFDEYTVGKYHLDEYGNPNNPAEYKSIIEYSPYNNIKENVNYPTTLIITSENDDRVPPMHSYKFAAALQNRAAQKNPIYLKTLRKSGHYGKSATYKDRITQKSEFYSFLLYHLTK